MYRFLLKLLMQQKHYKHSEKYKELQQINEQPTETTSSLLDDNVNLLKSIFKHSSDLELTYLESESGVRAVIAFIDGLVNKDLLNRDVIRPFKQYSIDKSIRRSVEVASYRETTSMKKAIDDLLSGNAVLMIDGSEIFLIIDAKKWEKRAVEEPDNEKVTRGPREGFVENIRSNTSLLRRKIKNPNLVFETMSLGRETKTAIAIAYIDGISDTNVLSEARTRLKTIDTDAIWESGYIEQFIEDYPFSPFPTISNTQKPDTAAAKLMEGRVAILCDGTPHVLTVPHIFTENFQASEDFYIRPIMASFLRLIRISAFLISIMTPAIYVALLTHSQEMIPTILLITVSGAREEIPFPTFAEAFIMLLIFEFLRESGVRLPRAIGSAISIVGALVVGEAAVNAGIVSAPVVIVVAITGVTSFIIPSLTELMTVLRFFFLFLAAFTGLFGISVGIFIILIHAVSLQSFGIPYIWPLTPADGQGLKDTFFRFPLWLMKLRPKSIAGPNRRRQGDTGRN